MRTISNTLQKRLIHQAEEASFQGLAKVATSLEFQVENNPVRSDSEEYVYSHAQMHDDVEKLLWAATVRVQDYFNKTADASEIEPLIAAQAGELIEAIRKKLGSNAILGPYEPLVPGELRMEVEIDDE